MTTKKNSDDRVELAKRISKYTVKKKTMSALELIFRYIILICIGFIIITPLYTNIKEALTEQSMLGLKNTAWIPPAVSL
nr:hypothetical protein [Lachnospiraceae bacterium]